MKYVEMTIGEALEYYRGNKSEKVLVAVYDLEDEYGISSFQKKNRKECEDIIKSSKTIGREYCDEIIEALRCFSVKQDLESIRPKGIMTTILYRQRE